MLSIYLLVTALCFVSAKPREQDLIVLKPVFLDKARPAIKKCEDEINPPPDAFNNVLKGHVENDAGVKFVYCYLADLGIITQDGHYVVDKIANLVDDKDLKQETTKALEDCNKINGKDNLDTLRLLIGCYKDTSPVLFTQ